MKKIVLCACFTLLLWSCESKQQKLYQEVMHTHDVVMPRMDEIMELKSSLTKRIVQLQSDSLANPNAIEELEASKAKLNEADEAMMNWMRQFESDYEDMTRKETIRYLEAQKVKIEEVAHLMNNSIEEAKTQLKNHAAS